MQKIPLDVISSIQKKLNIVDVIGKYLPLKRQGKNYFAICPFHDDHNPSLSISEEKQIYTCFVCGASGNVFNFVMDYEKISFVKSVSLLGKQVGINIDVNDNTNLKKEDENKKYYDMYDIVNKYYQNNIKSKYGNKALEYLKKRKITDEIIKEFGIGLSFNDNTVSKLLEKKKYDINDIVDIGLCGRKDNFTYDIFRNRIMFPLWNNDGLVVGFSGRIYNGENESKYVNSSESKIFKKGKILYNYHNAKKYAEKENEIIIVEGFMDVIRLYSIGIKNVVATMGTAITKDHINLIMHLSKNVILCFDGDKAGEKATISCLSELDKVGIKPKIIRLEDDLDPDDYIIKNGKDMFLNHLNNPLTPLNFNMDIKRKQTDFNDYNEISNYVKSMALELNKINDDIVFELTIKKLAMQTNLDIDTIKDIIKKEKKEEIKIIPKKSVLSKNKYEKAEEYLIYYMLLSSDAIMLYKNNISYLSNSILSKLASKILEFYDKKHYINVTDFTLYLEDDSKLISEVLRIDALDMPKEVTNEVLEDYIETIDEGIRKKEMDRLKKEIKEEIDVTKKVKLLNKLMELKKGDS